jgi:hypothetical protein
MQSKPKFRVSINFVSYRQLTISRQYRSVLRAACVDLQACSSNGCTAFFDSCEMVWAMCEALFIDFDGTDQEITKVELQ